MPFGNDRAAGVEGKHGGSMPYPAARRLFPAGIPAIVARWARESAPAAGHGAPPKPMFGGCRMGATMARRTGALEGEIAVPGDKSISHRALLLAALAAGRSRVGGLLEAEDVMATAAALRMFGADVRRLGPGEWRIDGPGAGGLAEPEGVLDLGNSGTGARLIAGVAAGHPVRAIIDGDASLRRRPMARIAEPLSQMGAEFDCAPGGRLPMVVRGAETPMPIHYRMPMASAQVKSAILFAGLTAPGETAVIEPAPTRDHSERMMRAFGADIGISEEPGGRRIRLAGEPELAPRDIEIAGDPSSAAFPLAAALTVPGSGVAIRGVGLNPLRTGFLETLADMGADLRVEARGERGGEPFGDVTARYSRLTGAVAPAERAPRTIDEYPILAAAAACAEGESRFEGLGELRHKESDRLAAIAEGLAAVGAEARVEGDALVVAGRGRPPPGGARVVARGDHRIAMAFLTLGLASERPIGIDDDSSIGTSFPGFAETMRGLGAAIGGGAPAAGRA